MSNPVLTLESIVSPLRIVCLVPSITQLIADLDLGDYLVGRTGFCIHPAPIVARIAKVGGTKTVNLDKIRALAPTHVIVNVDENTKDCVAALRGFVPEIVVTHPLTPLDNLQLVDQLIATFSLHFAMNSIAFNALLICGNRLKEQLSSRIHRLQNALPHRRATKVLYLIWRDPWMTVAQDTYISQMLGLIGWNTLPAVRGGDGLHSPGATRYPAIPMDASWLSEVQKVLLSSEPYRFTQANVQEVSDWMAGRGANATVQLVDGELLSWYGSKAVAGLDYLEALSAEESVSPASDGLAA
jgi:hypothetical protein